MRSLRWYILLALTGTALALNASSLRAQDAGSSPSPVTDTAPAQTPAQDSPSTIVPLDVLKDTGIIEDRTSGVDVSLKVGSGTGDVMLARRTENEADVRYKFGGLSVAPAINQHFSQKISLCYEYQFLIDLKNDQVARQGAAISAIFHLLGGARRVGQETAALNVIRRNSYNLSFVSSAAFQSYTVSLKDGTSRSLSGSTLEILLGGEYRQDVNDAHAIGLEVLQTVHSIPTSVNRLSTNVQKWALFWRIYL